MKPLLTVTAADGRSVPYYFGRGLLESAPEIIERHAAGGRRLLITSRGVEPLFGARFRTAFGTPGPLTFIVEDGEASKSFQAAYGLVGEFLGAGARRDAVVIALGGGAVGDLAGFAAAIYLRGIDLVHVPTTLLAQVDSSIGGKVAVNHERGKNLIGAFHQPAAIIADPVVLQTLPRREILSGIYEALKGGVIGDVSLFELCESSPDALLSCDLATIEELVKKAVTVKSGVVSADEREGDLRRLLNYGHTIGHGIETALHYSGLTHGEAVAWGMLAANSVAVRRGMLDSTVALRIEGAIRAFDLQPLPPVDRAAVKAAVDHDKKFTEDRRVMVLPRSIGVCEVVQDVTDAEIALAIDSIAG